MRKKEILHIVWAKNNVIRSWISICFVLFLASANALETADSLKLIWADQTKSMDVRLGSMQQYCDLVLLRSDPDSAFGMAQLIFELAEQEGLSVFMVEAMRIKGESYHYRGNIPEAMASLDGSLQLAITAKYTKGMAKAYNSLGNILAEKGDYLIALNYYNNSLEISKTNFDTASYAGTCIAMGILHYDRGNSLKSLALFEQALRLNHEVNDIREMGRINNNIGVIYHEQGNYGLAMEYFVKAVSLFEQCGEKRGIASGLNNLGDLYASQEKYEEALSYNIRSLEMRKDLGDIRGMANCYNVIGDNYSQQEKFTEALLFYKKSANIREELGEKKAMSRVYGNIGQLYLKQNNYQEGMLWCRQAFELAREIGAKMEELVSCDCLFNIYKALNKPEIALQYHERMFALEDSLKSEETAQLLQVLEFKKIMVEDSLQKEQEKVLVEMEHQTQVSRKNKQRNTFIIIGIAIFLFAGGLYSRLRFIRKSSEIIRSEKDRSEKLLLNILPAETAMELKAKGYVKARSFDLVTVMFTDFKSFTQMSENLSAQELVNEIDYCFRFFDKIISRHNIEKIKTIGDAYMCAGGLPIPNDTNPIDIVAAALDIQSFMLKLKEKRIKANKPYFELRIGIHSGNVIAGVVGTKKFQYDIWGDTVNIASRMESCGEVGHVNISKSTYELVKSKYDCIDRGEVDVKNKGAMEMYFVKPSND